MINMSYDLSKYILFARRNTGTLLWTWQCHLRPPSGHPLWSSVQQHSCRGDRSCTPMIPSSHHLEIILFSKTRWTKSCGYNQLEQLEAAKDAYLCSPLVTFPCLSLSYLTIPFLTFSYHSLPILTISYHSLPLHGLLELFCI